MSIASATRYVRSRQSDRQLPFAHKVLLPQCLGKPLADRDRLLRADCDEVRAKALRQPKGEVETLMQAGDLSA